MKNISFLLIISLISFHSYGQSAYAFKVIANKGANQVKTGDNLQPLKAGTSIKHGDELIVGENAYLGLVSSAGKPMELKKAGNYKVSDLTAQLKTGSTVLNKYTDFILSSNAEQKKNRLSATGAVHRATETNAIHVMLPDNQNSGVYSSKAIINWDGSKIQGPYVVTFKNMFDDKLDQFETPETTLEVDLTKYTTESAILLFVSSKANPKMASKDYTLRKLSTAEQEKVQVQLTEFKTDAEEETALNQFLLAAFFEENKLLVDAIAAYEKAVKLEPSYKESYDEFLIRNGMKK